MKVLWQSIPSVFKRHQAIQFVVEAGGVGRRVEEKVWEVREVDKVRPCRSCTTRLLTFK